MGEGEYEFKQPFPLDIAPPLAEILTRIPANLRLINANQEALALFHTTADEKFKTLNAILAEGGQNLVGEGLDAALPGR